jgi:hypothetical protein
MALFDATYFWQQFAMIALWLDAVRSTAGSKGHRDGFRLIGFGIGVF